MMNSETLKEKILDWGASLVGFANLKGIITQRWGSLTSGISIAVRLSQAIIAEIETEPTSIYAHHYYVANLILDMIAFKTANHLQSRGYQALPVPASQKYDPVELKGDISHKMVATSAGLGWIGKNALLITPQYGPRIRLVSVLTDAPLIPSQPVSESKCGKCRSCIAACPANALLGSNWTRKSERADLISVDRCNERILRNKTVVGEQVCGVCIRACPIGKHKAN